VFRGHESWVFNVETHFARLRVFRGRSSALRKFRFSFSVFFIIHMSFLFKPSAFSFRFSLRSETLAFSLWRFVRFHIIHPVFGSGGRREKGWQRVAPRCAALHPDAARCARLHREFLEEILDAV
jgi:hypothetical protein